MRRRCGGPGRSKGDRWGGSEVLDRSRVPSQGLLDAVLAVSSGANLEATLRRIVQAAVDLVSARYGAVTILGRAGQLDHFVQVGVDAAAGDRVRAVRWRCARRDGLRRATAASGRCHETFGVRGVPAGSSPDADLSGSADPVGRAGCRAAVPDREDGWAGFHRRRHAHGAGAGRRGRDGGRQAQVFQQARRARHQ